MGGGIGPPSRSGSFANSDLIQVVEAMEWDDCSPSESEAAREAYIRAYKADRKNDAALHGVVANLLNVCSELAEKNSRLEAAVQTLMVQPASGSTISWDVSAMDVSSMKEGDAWVSAKFFLLGSDVQASLKFYPKGEERVGRIAKLKREVNQTALFTSLYLRVHKPSEVDFSIRVDENPTRRLFLPTGSPGVGSHAFCPAQSMYSSITVIVHKVEKKEFRDTGDGELVQTFSAPCLQEDDRVGRGTYVKIKCNIK